MVAMAGLQVFIVRFFFQGARKGEWFTSRPLVSFYSVLEKCAEWRADLKQAMSKYITYSNQVVGSRKPFSKDKYQDF